MAGTRATGRCSSRLSLAQQLGAALFALSRSVATQTDRSVFSGDLGHRHKPMQDAFLVGVLSTLLAQGVPASWPALLEDLNFPETNWDFSSWVTSPYGKAGNTSRTVAEAVFASVFAQGRLPEAVTDLALFSSGRRGA